MFPIALQDFDEVLERFSIVGIIVIQWTDKNLIWSPADYGRIDVTNLRYIEVWVPELKMINSSEKIDSFGKNGK